MDRRDFIKLTAITGTSATLASCGSPENQLIRFIPDEDLVPGVAEWKPSVCPLCHAGCGLDVRIMEAEAEVVRNGQLGVINMGAAKKLEGHPTHPISQGGLCPRGQAAIQITYHPDRLVQPMKRVGARGSAGSESFAPVSWDEAIGQLVQKLDSLADAHDQKSLMFLTRPRRSRRVELITEFLSRYGAPPPIGCELFGEDVLRRANGLAFGREQLPTFDLARARFVIVFGADLLGTWNSPVAQNAAYGAMRQGRPGIRAKLVQVESRMSATGACADEWIPARPGTEGVLALGLAHVILKRNLRPASAGGRAGALIDGWSSGLSDYEPEKVQQLTGVPAKHIERLAGEMGERLPAVAIIGGAPLAMTNGLFHALAVNALNALIGNVGEPGGVFFTPQLTPTAGVKAPAVVGHWPPADLEKLATQVLVLDDVNPVFASPSAWHVREALEKIPFIVSFGSFVDETSALADLILPDHSFLESWVDSLPESGSMVAVANVAGPAMRPLHQTRAMPEVLLEIAGRLKAPLNPALPWKTFDEMLKASFADLPTPAGSGAGADAWSAAQKQGGWWGEAPRSRVSTPAGDARATATAGRSVRFEEPRFDGDSGQYPYQLLPYPSQSFYDGSAAHLPWLQELPDPLTSAMWSSWVEINPRTAARLNVGPGDLVDVASSRGVLRVPVVVSPGIAPDLIAIPVGQGHTHFTRYAAGRGVNPISILAPMTESETGALAWAATRVRVTRAADADGRLILFAGEMRERPHEKDTR